LNNKTTYNKVEEKFMAIDTASIKKQLEIPIFLLYTAWIKKHNTTQLHYRAIKWVIRGAVISCKQHIGLEQSKICFNLQPTKANGYAV